MKPYYQENGITIYHGAAEAVLPTLSERFDLAFFDPPYNVGKDYGTSRDGEDRNLVVSLRTDRSLDKRRGEEPASL